MEQNFVISEFKKLFVNKNRVKLIFKKYPSKCDFLLVKNCVAFKRIDYMELLIDEKFTLRVEERTSKSERKKESSFFP